MKHEWRKHEKELYLPKQKPSVIDIPVMKYFTITGEGNPNSEEFSEKIAALYGFSYAVRMMPKKGIIPDGYFEYTVYPLEGIWDLINYDVESEIIDKNNLKYKIMIRQPEFVDDTVFQNAYEIVKDKDIKYINDICFEEINDGLCVQMLHIGPYEEENKTFDEMENFISENDFIRKSKTHREIYISDFRKVEKSKLKTVLRCFIENN